MKNHHTVHKVNIKVVIIKSNLLTNCGYIGTKDWVYNFVKLVVLAKILD